MIRLIFLFFFDAHAFKILFPMGLILGCYPHLWPEKDLDLDLNAYSPLHYYIRGSFGSCYAIWPIRIALEKFRNRLDG